MLRTLIITVFSLLWASSIIAQTNNYYWADNNRLELTPSNTHFIITADEASTLTNLRPESLKKYESWAHKSYAIAESTNETTSKKLITQLGFNANEVQVISGYALSDGFIIYPTRTIVAQFKDKSDIRVQESIGRMLTKFSVKNITEKLGTYRIELENADQVLEAANQLKESGLCFFAQPDFYAPIERFQVNDPLFTQQFQMNNTGQTLDGVTGANDADCNALEAWNISIGSASTTVAVIDDGMEDHEDFNNSSGQSRYTSGFSPANSGNGDAVSGSAHGVSCAGSITASHNNIGVRGVAPLSDIISVNIFVGGESTQDIADGITWAKNQGADVLSNSWGYTSCTVSFSNINSAISDANSNGRGGLGCVIVFASGNGYKSCVDYPANNADVIAVGAFANTGIRSAYSNYGPALDIMAPSNNVGGPGAGVRTTDRMGSPGYNGTNYTSSFGGTSSACPVVAGVATLLLGYDASLTSAEVKNILYSTAIDMGPTGVDNEYANGRVNALGALQAAGGGGGPGGLTCNTTVNAFPYTEGFEGSFGAWTQESGDDFDWTRQSGGTPSSGTGPSGAATGSFYVYTEASNPNNPSKAVNMYACFNFGGLSSPEMTFNYHMNGTAIGTLNLQVSTDGSSWTTVWTRSGSQGANWLNTTVNLSAYAGQTIFLRFAGTTGTSWSGDMCVDDISISDPVTGGISCTNKVNSYPYSESFETGTGNWTQDTNDDLNWTRDSGGTPSSGTGPTTAADGSFYMYVEASSPNYPAKDAIIYRCFNFSSLSSPEIDFSYHMYGTALGTLRLEASTDGANWNTLWSLSGNQGNAWFNANVDLSAYAGNSTVFLRYYGTTGTSWSGDMTIDAISIDDAGSTGGGGCVEINFNNYPVNSYGGAQDNGTSTILYSGLGLLLENNAWKSIDLNYTVTANTVVELQFASTAEGEIHGFGFDNDNIISSNYHVQFHGTQNWGNQTFNNYPANNTFVYYTVPVGQYYTGTFDRFFFTCDNDANPTTGYSYFYGIKIYEGSACISAALAHTPEVIIPANGLISQTSDGSIESPVEEQSLLSSDELRLYPSPASNLLNVEYSTSIIGNSQVSIVDLYGRVIQDKQYNTHEGNNQWQIDLNGLNNGAYILVIRDESGAIKHSRRFSIIK